MVQQQRRLRIRIGAGTDVVVTLVPLALLVLLLVVVAVMRLVWAGFGPVEATGLALREPIEDAAARLVQREAGRASHTPVRSWSETP
ncbi:MAG TPA: hypothetical protein VFG69_02600 [Nannocystaceae bacterium]|nr:hypothetical protein [Nannocystaceae bacterium]